MGNSKSKIKPGSRGKVFRKSDRGGQFQGADDSADCEKKYDTELLLLKRTLHRDPEIFVLNNLMMCVQFFGNYEEEIAHAKETLASTRETELNERLPAQKHVLLPDVLQEHVARNVGFTSARQTFRPTIEPLQPVRIYTVHENIEIVEDNCSQHYSNVNDSVNILLKPTQHQGYVQLQLLDEFRVARDARKMDDEADLSSIAEDDDDDELYSDGDSVYGPKPRSHLSPRSTPSRRSRHGSSKTSGSKASRSLPDLHVRADPGNSGRNGKRDTDYERLRFEKSSPRSKTQGSASHDHTSSNSSGYRSDNCAMDSDSSCNPGRKSRISRNSSYEELGDRWGGSGDIPSRCFKRVTYTAEGKVYDPRDDKIHLLNSKQRRIKLALRRHNYDLFFASSTVFMKHFIKLFVHRLAEPLGFDQECVEDMKREGCVLYCDKIMVANGFRHSQVEQYEIIPAFWLQWPGCAQEWLDRPRNTWPDSGDVEKIKDFGCYVVPEGFVPKGGSSNFSEDLEWQLTFPTAERYLETCMTSSQVQVYLIILMLHKTFMRPVFDTMFSLTAAHIRHKMFWMIEENDRPSKWPDNRMGECLMTFLDSLYRNISQNEPMLRDYFVKGRNLFQRVPCEHLLHTQKQLKRIMENPVMYVFHAMENIRYSGNFFPRLDFETLLKILTIDAITLLNPALAQQISRPVPRPDQDSPATEEKYSKIGFWDAAKNQRHKRSARAITDRTLINPSKATDAIIEISTRCAELESPRLCVLLDFFVRHFIEIAERCHRYNAHRQKAVYLDHAERLSILLFEHERYRSEARGYRDKIKVLRKRTTASRERDEQPYIPKRNSEAALYVAPLKHRFAGEPRNEANPDPAEPAPSRRTIVEAVVHEARYEEPAEQKSDATGCDPSRSLENGDERCTVPSPEESQRIVTLRRSLESGGNETTYI